MTSAAPAISVLLPVHNAAATLARAIGSIRSQRDANWELVVIDDGSTDGSAEIAASIARRDGRVRLFREEHAGLVPALNFGLGRVRGEFVARMDADDESHPERLAEQLNFLRAPAHRDIGLVGCGVAFGGDRTTNAGYALHVDWLNSIVTADDIALNRFVESPFAHPSVMFRRELVDRHGGYRAGDFPEDYELWLRWLDAGVGMAKLSQVLLTWHDSHRRMSRLDPRYRPEAFFATKAPWIARWLEQNQVISRQPSNPLLPRRSGRRILVWGAGRPTRKRAAHLAEHGVPVSGYIDVDARKVTRAIGGTGCPVILPSDLPPPGEVFVLAYVSSRGARDYTRADLQAREYVEGRDFLMCA